MKKNTRKAVSDPVCGAKVDRERSRYFSTQKDRTYYFCTEDCYRAFEERPDEYLRPCGFMGRFLERLARANKKAFGSGGPSCCK